MWFSEWNQTDNVLSEATVETTEKFTVSFSYCKKGITFDVNVGTLDYCSSVCDLYMYSICHFRGQLGTR